MDGNEASSNSFTGDPHKSKKLKAKKKAAYKAVGKTKDANKSQIEESEYCEYEADVERNVETFSFEVAFQLKMNKLKDLIKLMKVKLSKKGKHSKEEDMSKAAKSENEAEEMSREK